MTPSSRQTSKKRTAVVAAVAVVLVVAVLAGVLALAHVGPFARSASARTSSPLCTAVVDIDAYAKAHPAQRTVRSIYETLAYDHSALLGVPPTGAMGSNVTSALSSSEALVYDSQILLKGQKLTAGQDNAAKIQIGTWHKTLAAITAWSAKNCPRP